MEGLWGILICTFILYPAAYITHGSDHGSYENPFNTIVMLKNSTAIQIAFLVYFVSVFMYNILGCLVIYSMDSVWRSILDNFRPISVWSVDLIIFYFFNRSYGEALTSWSWLQLLGLYTLVYGTAIYNAPNPGSILLRGDLLSCFCDLSHEYQEYVHSSSYDDDDSAADEKMNSVVLTPATFPSDIEMRYHGNTPRITNRSDDRVRLPSDDQEMNTHYSHVVPRSMTLTLDAGSSSAAPRPERQLLSSNSRKGYGSASVPDTHMPVKH